MNNLQEYIIEKLHIDKDMHSSSKYEKIYNVHTDDLVLCQQFSKKNSRYIYIFLYIGKIVNINDNELTIKNIKTDVERIYTFEDPTNSSPHFTDCFAYTRIGIGGWASIMTKEKALKLLHDRKYRNFWGSFKIELPKGVRSTEYIESLEDELNFYDKK